MSALIEKRVTVKLPSRRRPGQRAFPYVVVYEMGATPDARIIRSVQLPGDRMEILDKLTESDVAHLSRVLGRARYRSA